MTHKPLTADQQAHVLQWLPMGRRIALDSRKMQSADIDDAVQDVFLQMCKSIRTHDPSKS